MWHSGPMKCVARQPPPTPYRRAPGARTGHARFSGNPIAHPGEAASETLLKRCRAWRVIAAKADRHDANPAWIDFGPGCKIVPYRSRIVLGIVSQIEVAKADAFAIPRSIHYQARNAAGDQIGHALQVLNLLGDIETIEENHVWHFARAVLRLGMNIDRRKARAFICDLDVLEPRPLGDFGGVPKACDPSHVGVEPTLVLRLQETFADVIVRARALQILCAACGIAIADAFAAALFHVSRFATPFIEPRVIIANGVFKSQSDSIDFSDLRPTPRGHIQADQQAM